MIKSFNELESLVSSYLTYEEIEQIRKAYNLASYSHRNQYRDSGEEYIVHPLNVAYFLALMKADASTICAGLLHDTVEDTDLTLDDISENFNSEIALLVDGVTKISKLKKTSSLDRNYANMRKNIVGVTKDPRILIVKLSDRIHNISTLQYKSPDKQRRIAYETIHIYSPLAYSIGAYDIKNSLEDISFKYIDPEDYKRLSEQRELLLIEYKDLLDEVKYKLRYILSMNDIDPEISYRIKSVYQLFKKQQKGWELDSINDLFSIKIILDDVLDCYKALGLVHSLYVPKNSQFKDYISRPKTNMYQALHTTIFAHDSLIQTQIKTHDMNSIDRYGICSYWNKYGNSAKDEMVKDLSTKCRFYRKITEFDSKYEDDHDFIEQVEHDILTSKIFVNNQNGETIELPSGSTVAYYASEMGIDTNDISIIRVNDKIEDLDYVLKSKDIISLTLIKQKKLAKIKESN